MPNLLFVALALLLIVAPAASARAQAPSPAPGRETGFVRRSFTLGSGTMSYRVYVPRGYDPAKQYPVVLYLHGGSALGDDNEKQIGGFGLGSVIQLYSWRYPERYTAFIAVFPQTKKYWFGDAAELAAKALDHTVTEFNGDPNRLYVTGFSLGGYGSLYLAARYPKKFAAVVAVSGGVLPPSGVALSDLKTVMPPDMFALYSARDAHAAVARAVGATPVWLFHGAKDTIIPVTESRKMEAALRAASAPPKYTEYEDETHFIADRAYTDGELWEWLFEQRRVETVATRGARPCADRADAGTKGSAEDVRGVARPYAHDLDSPLLPPHHRHGFRTAPYSEAFVWQRAFGYTTQSVPTRRSP